MTPRPTNNGRGPLRLVLATSAGMATLANWPLWQALSELGLLQSAKGWGLAVALALVVFGALVALQSLLAWRFTLKPLAIFLLLAAAAGAHYMLAYRIVIDQTMLVNVLQTNPGEAVDLLSLRMVATLVLGGLLPAWIVWRMPVQHARWPRQLGRNLLATVAGLALVVAAVVASFQPLSSTMRNHKQLRYLINPLNSVYALGMVASEPLRRNDRVLLPLATDARLGPSHAAGTRPPLLLLVLGETARAANFSLNGYARPTNPELAKLPVISWRNAWSCGTNTAASVPCMFSHLGRDDFSSRKANHENLLDVAQRAGLAVLWLDNQAGCKGTCARVPNVETGNLKHPTLCADGECWDPIMLDGLDARIAALPAAQRDKGVLLVMHQMGSHGPAYYKRVPQAFKRFLPECSTNNLQDCSREQLVNAYDNTIAYTDHFLAQASHDTAMVYVSDHGESLGENNLYLHGLPYAIAPDVQKHVPWITWLSPGFAQRQRLDAACLQGRADAAMSHDHYFHSVLGLLDVQTSVYQPALDAYAACRGR
jgi:lipid A ethanolaminephosphotransferase